MNVWMPGVEVYSGLASKTGYSSVGYNSPKRGDVKHSAEGTSWDVMHDLLTGPAEKSWHFTVGYDRIEQHHAITANCWHAGDSDDDGAVRANIDLVGIEHLGVAGEPLTPWQTDATARITQFCMEQFGYERAGRYPMPNAAAEHIWTLAEHTQVSDTYTACPSGRIPWGDILVLLQTEDEMTEAQIKQLNEATIRSQYALNQIDILKEWRKKTNERIYALLVAGKLTANQVADLKAQDAEFEARLDEAGLSLQG